MYSGKLVFAQAMEHLPLHVFRQCVTRYAGRYPTLSFSHLDQFLCMAFAQLTYRESLRDIETCLRAHDNKLYHLGIRGNVARSTLADANEKRDWRIWHDLAMHLISQARALYAGDAFGVDLDNTVYALDTTAIDLCLSVFPWARFRRAKAAVKLHTLLDLRGNIPAFIHISGGKMHEVNVLDQLPIEAGSFYLMDRGFTDFTRLHALTRAGAYFIIRAKHNLHYRRIASHGVDKTTGLRSDQTIHLAGVQSSKDYPDRLRRVSFYDTLHKKKLVFLTNNHDLPALTIAQLYKQRWQVELFFKWIKQHLRIKAYFGTSPNAVKTQVWIAIATYVLIAILKKRAACSASLYTDGMLKYVWPSLTGKSRPALFQKCKFAQFKLHEQSAKCQVDGYPGSGRNQQNSNRCSEYRSHSGGSPLCFLAMEFHKNCKRKPLPDICAPEGFHDLSSRNQEIS